MLELEFAEATDRGPVREHNEDFVGHSLPPDAQQTRARGFLFARADGVGGQEKGEVASQMTVDTLLAEYTRPTPSAEAPALRLARAVEAANTAVYEAAHGGIASTLVACALRYDRATIVHVGDSRAYLIRNGHAQRLTRDHTVAGEQVRMGLFTDQQARRSPAASTLTRSIGINLFVSPEVNEHQLRPNDLLLLCSDGLHGAVGDAEIARTLSTMPRLQEAALRLIAIANQSDGGDNVSVQLIRVKSVEAVGMYRGRPYRLHA